ncbi:phenylalanine--tRNA ligase subunit beta [Teredinibacter waterburyi]|uniref:phenylalanine--tRNA ligase subunit beta n=1 Tax=Teredinibacter waterburyi TaxID=1500538 RepID=UPI00165F5BC2|nr:phenylalanine--tRNA ligase subunit beta [Teredinibacter waterburyi]
MKFSESWLRSWVSPSISTQALVDQLTMAGLEVDAVEPVAGDFNGVVVGEIIAVAQHPDADKLRVCQVAGGADELTQVVCGAPNARVGIKIPFATVGASLPPGPDGKPFKIKRAKLRGVESFGMLCGQTELQAGEDDSGLWELPLNLVVGAELREALNLNDNIIEVDLTPNRSDCLSIRGLARETGVLNRTQVSEVTIEPVAATSDKRVDVNLGAGDACPRYVGRVISGVDLSRPSPQWLQERLRRSDVRSIDAVVDVTNYLLLELGQPMHAFDLGKLSGDVSVRLSNTGEKLTILGGQEVELNDSTLLITDKSGPIAMAGIMGGEPTSVTAETQDIFLESAFFNPLAIAGKARNYGLHTDSSHRFERGVDPDLCLLAMERATELLLQIVGGDAGPVVCAERAADLPAQRQVRLERSRIQSGLGFAMPDEEVLDILARLGLVLVDSDPQGWAFSVPSYRFDISIDADLLEELARIYGYNNLPTTDMRIPAVIGLQTETVLDGDRFDRQLIARGYQEAITYSFIDPKMHRLFSGEQPAVELLNPISADLSVMRTSLIPGLATALMHNVNRQQQRVRIFEKGLRFVPNGSETTQTQGIAGLIYGPREATSWTASKGDVDFYDIKGDLEALLELTARDISFQAGIRDYLHPGQTAEVVASGVVIGVVGALHPQLLRELGVSKAVFVFELDLAESLITEVPKFVPLSKFPEVSRDLAVVVGRQLEVSALQSAMAAVAGENLKNLKVFDVYSGEGIDPQRKSVAFNLTFQHPSRTLNEEEINASIAAVVQRLEEEFDASLR